MKKILLLIMTPMFIYLYANEAFLPTKKTFLSANQAFIPKITQTDNIINVKISVAKGYYLYKDKIKLSSSEGFTLNYLLPKAKEHKSLGVVELVYGNNLEFNATLNTQKMGNQKAKITLEFQGCSAQGLCYRPMKLTKEFNVDFKTTTNLEDLSDTDKITSYFNRNLFIILITFFGLGILLSLTPCVFPLIPILSTIIISQSKNITVWRSFFLSVVYVLSMSMAYTIAGIITAYSGQSIQVALQTPWVLILFSLILIFLSLSMFGFYNIEIPKWIRSRASKASNSAKGKGVLGVAIMGFLSALIVSPCVAPALAGVLAYISHKGDMLLGGLALFSLGLGMGIPLLIVGVGAGKFMPKPGVWMNNIKAIFGVMILGLAIWMLDRILDESITMLLISFLAIISSLYLGALDTHHTQTKGWLRFSKGLGILLFIYGLIMFIGSFTKGTLYEPLRSFSNIKINSSSKVIAKDLIFKQTITDIENLEKILKNSKDDQIIMLVFSASWCIQCKELEEEVLKNSKSIKMIENFLIVKVDISKDNKESRILKNKFEVQGPPAIRFLKNGKEINRASRMQGPNLETFLAKISKLKN